jgi:hypothetical protein
VGATRGSNCSSTIEILFGYSCLKFEAGDVAGTILLRGDLRPQKFKGYQKGCLSSTPVGDSGSAL